MIKTTLESSLTTEYTFNKYVAVIAGPKTGKQQPEASPLRRDFARWENHGTAIRESEDK